jgi:hypothetical protein
MFEGHHEDQCVSRTSQRILPAANSDHCGHDSNGICETRVFMDVLVRSFSARSSQAPVSIGPALLERKGGLRYASDVDASPVS